MLSRIAEANAAIEDQVDSYSDEEDEDLDDDENLDEIDTSSRLNQPLSYSRSLMELYRASLFIHSNA